MHVTQLIWDNWNIAHIARHEVTPEEVEEVCHGLVQAEEGYAGRIRLVGPTLADRMLAVVLAPKGKTIYYPVTARPASRPERKKYTQWKGGTTL